MPLPVRNIIFLAEAKQGKSRILLNEAVDLMKQDLAVLYIDSELNSRMFTCRLIAHLACIEFNRLKTGQYTKAEQQKISKCIAWLQTRKFIHLHADVRRAKYLHCGKKGQTHPRLRRIDYRLFKGKGEGDAFASYQELGRLVDMVKNQICGETQRFNHCCDSR